MSAPIRIARHALWAPTLALTPVLLLVAALSGCGDDTVTGDGGDGPDAGPGSLAGTSWVLAGWTEEAGAAVQPPVPSADAVLDLGTEGRLSGSGGCNRFFGTWEQTGDRLALRLGGSTEMACAPPVTAQETAVFAALERTASADRTGDTLRLLDAEGLLLLEYSVGVQDLAGTTWTATGINDGRDALVSGDTTSRASVTFGTDGTVSGTGGCNSFSGPVTLTPPDGIDVAEDLRTTLRACEDPALEEQEQQLLAALQRATTYEVSGSTLTLRDDTGAMQATFRLDAAPGADAGDGGADPDTPVGTTPGG